MHNSQLIKEDWYLGHSLYLYYHNMVFQGQNTNKLWINLNKTDGDFQAEFVCEYGYTLWFQF